MCVARSKSLSDIPTQQVQKVNYEELQKVQKQIKQNEDQWQDVSISSNSVPLRCQWLPDTSTVLLPCGLLVAAWWFSG